MLVLEFLVSLFLALMRLDFFNSVVLQAFGVQCRSNSPPDVSV